MTSGYSQTVFPEGEGVRGRAAKSTGPLFNQDSFSLAGKRANGTMVSVTAGPIVRMLVPRTQHLLCRGSVLAAIHLLLLAGAGRFAHRAP